jgi:hypothetical protein
MFTLDEFEDIRLVFNVIDNISVMPGTIMFLVELRME